MITLPFTEAKDHLSRLVDSVHATHDRVTITRHGRAAAVLVSPDDLEELEETIAILSTPGLVAQIERASEEVAAGATMTTEEMLARVRADSSQE